MIRQKQCKSIFNIRQQELCVMGCIVTILKEFLFCIVLTQMYILQLPGSKKDQFACRATIHQVFFDILSINQGLCMQQEQFTCIEIMQLDSRKSRIHCSRLLDCSNSVTLPASQQNFKLAVEQETSRNTFHDISSFILSTKFALQQFFQGKTFCLETLLKYKLVSNKNVFFLNPFILGKKNFATDVLIIVYRCDHSIGDYW